MKRNAVLYIIAAILLLALVLTASPISAQLILSNQKMKIVKVERYNHIIQGRVHEKDNTNVQYVQIDGNTRFSTNMRSVSQDEAWRLLKKDMIIRVKGGVTMGGQIKAKSIYW
jgi:hypothetical protein